VNFSFRFGNAQRTVAEARFELRRSSFRLDPRLLRRILLWALPFPALAALVLYLGQPAAMTILPLGFGAFVVLWQVLAYGSSGGRITPEQLEATSLYPKGVLIVLAIFWTALITLVCVALYLKFPNN
jgi:hypothetical protein